MMKKKKLQFNYKVSLVLLATLLYEIKYYLIYERWAKVYNIKQMAAALLYLREHDLMDYAALASSTEAAVDRAHKLAGELRDTEIARAHV